MNQLDFRVIDFIRKGKKVNNLEIYSNYKCNFFFTNQNFFPAFFLNAINRK